MPTISERLRQIAEAKAVQDKDAGRKAPLYGRNTEIEWKAAATIDALVEALEDVREGALWNHLHDVPASGLAHLVDQVDEALAMASKETDQ